MILNIMNHFPPFQKINPAFNMLLLLSLSILVLIYVVVCWNMCNDNYDAPIGFKDSNERRDNIDDDDDVNSTEVRFTESHCKDAEYVH